MKFRNIISNNRKSVCLIFRFTEAIRLAVIILILQSVTVLPGFAQEPSGDYGDAPDDSESYYPAMFSTSCDTARFPTKFGTHFSRIGQPGAYHVNTGEEWLGKQPDLVSVEHGASDAADPDGQPNLVNSDHWDGGFPKIPFFMVLTSIPPSTTLSFFVSKSVASSYYGSLYVNILIDWDQNGVWENVPNETPEWVVMNHTVNITPGQTSLETSAPFAWGWNALLAPQVFWVRMTLTRSPIGVGPYAPYLDANGCWDGSGVFQYGETEDFLFHPDCPLVQNEEGPWNPPGGGGGGGGGGKSNNWVTVRAVPKDQGIYHTQIAFVDFVVVPPDFVDPAGNTPYVTKWRIEDGGVGLGSQRGSGDLSPTTTHLMSDSKTWVGLFDPIPGGPDGTMATVVVNPRIHDYLWTDVIPITVRVKWPGIFVFNVEATVKVRHSNHIMGPFGFWPCFNNVERVISATSGLPCGDKGPMYSLLEDSMTNFETGNFAQARTSMLNLQAEIDNNQTNFEAEVREWDSYSINNYSNITQAICGIVEGLDVLITNSLPPVHFEPVLPGAWTNYPPSPGHIAGNNRYLRATCRYPGTTHICFQWWDRNAGGEGDWVTLGTQPVNADGLASNILNTVGMPDTNQWFRVYAMGEIEYPEFAPDESCDQLMIKVDNSSPDPALELNIVCPPDICARAIVEVTGIPESFSGEGYALIEVKSDESSGDEWVPLGVGAYFGDVDIPDDDGDPARIRIDASAMPAGTYTARCRLVDLAGNETVYAPIVPVTIHPSYMAWKESYGKLNQLGETNDDDDNLTLIEEYYLGYDPTIADAWERLSLFIGNNPGGGGSLQLSTLRRELFSGVEASVYSSADPDGEYTFWDAFDSEYPQDMNIDLEVNPLDFGPDTKQFFKQYLEER